MKTSASVRRSFMVFQLLSFASFATMNYFNIYLKDIGFTSGELGLWGAISGAIGMATLPVWGVVSDRTRSVKKVFLLSMVLYALCFVVLSLVSEKTGATMPYLAGVILLYGMVRMPTHSLGDAWSIGEITPYGIKYPEIRLWGSAGFGVVSIVYGIIGEKAGLPLLFRLTPVYVAALVILATRFRSPGAQAAKKDAPRIRPALLFKNPAFAAAFLMVFALAAYSSLTQPFYVYILEHAGLAGEKFGVISGWGAFVQVGTMLVLTRLLRNVPRERVLVAAGMIGAAEHLTYAMASGMPAMLAAGTLWGIEMAIYVSVLPGYIASLVPPEYGATAQTLSGTAAMLFSIGGSLLGGLVIGRMGISLYNGATAALQLLLTAAFCAAVLIGRKKTKIC